MDAPDLMALAARSAETDLAFLLRAKEEAKARMKADPSQENINAFNKGKAAVEAEMARKHTVNQDAPAASDRIGKLPAVLSYLERSGWKVRKTKLYADKKKGLLRVQPDGMVLRVDADAYAAGNLAPADAAPGADDVDTLRMKRELLAEELALKREINERTKFRNQRERGELLSRDEVDQQLVGAVTVLRASLRQWIYTNASEMVDMVGGDPKKIDEVVHFFVNASNDFFNSFARRRDFEIEIDDPEGLDGPGTDEGKDAA